MNSASTAQKIGVQNVLSNITSGQHYGVENRITMSSGSSLTYGTSNYSQGTNDNDSYGTITLGTPS